MYDVTRFLEDHPGGDEVLLTASGKDATVDFEDVGHSDDAKELMNKYFIGEIERSSVPVKEAVASRGRAAASGEKGNHSSSSGGEGGGGGFGKILQLVIPLLILAFALALRQYKKND